MSKKKKQEECPAGEKWAVPYADFLSLLLALFIALYAVSATNKSKLEALKVEFIKIFDWTAKPDTIQPVLPVPPNPGEESSETEGDRVYHSQQEVASMSIENVAELEDKLEEGGILEQIEQGVVLKLPANLIFKQGSADISNIDMMMYIKRIAQIIKKLPPQVTIDVRGYTDDSPLPRTSNFKDHYDLAAARALAVVRALIQDGVSPKQLAFTSYGKYKPLEPNNSAENRIKNNRVEIFLSTDHDDAQKVESILDKSIESEKKPSK